MEMVNEISAKILDLGAQIGALLGVFFIPATILGAILLVVFARYSYKLLKFVLPVAGIAIGAIVGAGYIAPYVETSLPVVTQYVNPYYVCAIVLAAILGVLCFKFHTFAILLIGAFAGFVVIGRIVKDLLLSLPFINAIAGDVIRLKSYIVGVIICFICMIVIAFLVKRYFKKIYVVTTSIGLTTATFGIAATLIFATTVIAPYATIAAAVIGFIVGSVFCYKQLGDVYADY